MRPEYRLVRSSAIPKLWCVIVLLCLLINPLLHPSAVVQSLNNTPVPQPTFTKLHTRDLPPREMLKTNKDLPEKILVGYTTNNCHDLNDMSKETKAVEGGVNVLIWSFISFEVIKNESLSDLNENKKDNVTNTGDNVRIKVSQNIENYKRYKESLASMGYDSVVHLVAFGGWNGAHLPPGFSAEELYKVFQSFNTQEVQSDEDLSFLWDGIDWDLEGHDNLQHPNNEFSVELLNQVGEFSQLAKNDGLIISMAPPESYLDTTSSRFSRFVNLTYPDDPWHQDFEYHGWNVYAFVMAKYGHCIDFVFLQFYESWSHALYQTEQLGLSQSAFLIQYVTNLAKTNFGYDVNFEDDPTVGLKNQFVKLPLSKLIFGFANGWAVGLAKAIYFNPSEIKLAYDQLKKANLEPRGCGYWVVNEEGNQDIYFTNALNDILTNSKEMNTEENDMQKCDKDDIICKE